MNYTFDQAKQAVAEKYQYEDWVTMVAGRTPGGAAMGRIIKDLCELMCNEAVKADRDRIFGESYFDIEMNSQVVLIDATIAPLPFPES